MQNKIQVFKNDSFKALKIDDPLPASPNVPIAKIVPLRDDASLLNLTRKELKDLQDILKKLRESVIRSSAFKLTVRIDERKGGYYKRMHIVLCPQYEL